MILKLDKATGFTAEGPIHIKTIDGRPFYVISKTGKVKFNLPKGEYITETQLKRLSTPHLYKFERKRKREHYNFDMPKPKQLKVEFRDNPNKASIFPRKHTIVMDHSFQNMPEYVKKYVFYHELGHYLYKTEEFCDEFAQEKMLKDGYNKSQIEAAARVTLHNGHDRHKTCINNLKKAKMK